MNLLDNHLRACSDSYFSQVTMAGNLTACCQEYLYMRNFDMSVYFHITSIPTFNFLFTSAAHAKCHPKRICEQGRAKNAFILIWGNAITDVFLQLLEEANDDGKRFHTGCKPETWVGFSSWCSGGIPGCDAYSDWESLIKARILRM